METQNQKDELEQTEDLKDSDMNSIENEDKKVEEKKKHKFHIIEFSIYFILCLFCLFVLPNYVIQRTSVVGASMEDTLHNKDSLMVEKLSYRFSDPKRFDIIVFFPFGKEVDEHFVKRIIGLPGETIQIKGQDIYINNQKLDDQYGKDAMTTAGMAANPVKLGPDEYFVLGDHRSVSRDSRYEDVGLVNRKNIDGKVILRVWPLNKFGIIK